MLMEGVTRRAGEGEVLAPESPEQTRARLAVLGGLAGAAVAGWALARLGDRFRRPGPQPPPRLAIRSTTIKPYDASAPAPSANPPAASPAASPATSLPAAPQPQAAPAPSQPKPSSN
jgi:hypothetical protein